MAERGYAADGKPGCFPNELCVGAAERFADLARRHGLVDAVDPGNQQQIWLA